MNIPVSTEYRLAARYQVFDPDGTLVREGACDTARHLDGNGFTTLGLNDVLDKYFAGSAYTAAWYIGLVDNAGFVSFAAGDTMASHTGWAESVAYSNSNRITTTWSAAAGGSKVTGNLDFSINGSVTIHGFFLATDNTKSGTSGLLLATVALGSNQALVNGQTLRLILTASASG